MNDISINLTLELEGKSSTSYIVCPIRLTNNKVERHVNLLIIQNKYYPKAHEVEEEEGEEIKYHYVWIIHLSRLVSSQSSKMLFYNLTNYDEHLMIREICRKGSVSVLPINEEKYISFTLFESNSKLKFRFIDSYRFMSASLDELISLLLKDKFTILQKEFHHLDKEHFELLTRKGVFPYDYIDNVDKLNETNLPPIKCFYNRLNDEGISKEKYEHAQNICNMFNIKSLGEYSDLYMKTDIILLATVMENFRQTAFEIYGLDPHWYYTMPSYTWDCMLKYTKCKLQILKDVDMILFMEKAIRGGVSMCCNRYSEANNEYLPNYNPSKPSKSLLYLDVNNLYGWAMTEALPYGHFKWLENFDNFNVMEIADDAEEGFILQVDLEYPKRLHDLHRDIPFCPEHRIPPVSKLPKLMTTLFDKKEYILHYRNLKQALEHGFVLKKIHKVLQFKQFKWLKPYIDLNTCLRAAATNNFKRNQLKLANNAIYAKTLEDIKRHRVVSIVNRYEGRYGVKNLISSPRFQSRTIFDDNLMVVELRKTEVIFNKPIYIGMVILDLSKICMYDFVGLRSKMYACKLYNTPNEEQKRVIKKSKGIKVAIVKNKITFEDYEKCLTEKTNTIITQQSIRSYAHNIYSIEQQKVGLSYNDNKGQLLSSSFDTLPWGHYRN
ncbi:uncharacterized protein LOC130450634 [Diorhabda sublineata]|uniref:uncharacterized protein LOC130450634 n=1 Tax=Diorhabda sublineata TaxID=1163346 RepID=UPI0024E11D44|nr:uncharacterized protein LOC130450634 [Diorhabda sublineata]